MPGMRARRRNARVEWLRHGPRHPAHRGGHRKASLPFIPGRASFSSTPIKEGLLGRSRRSTIAAAWWSTLGRGSGGLAREGVGEILIPGPSCSKRPCAIVQILTLDQTDGGWRHSQWASGDAGGHCDRRWTQVYLVTLPSEVTSPSSSESLDRKREIVLAAHPLEGVTTALARRSVTCCSRPSAPAPHGSRLENEEYRTARSRHLSLAAAPRSSWASRRARPDPHTPCSIGGADLLTINQRALGSSASASPLFQRLSCPLSSCSQSKGNRLGGGRYGTW
jgi:hypothetical protein